MFDFRSVAGAWIAGFLVIALAMGALVLVTDRPLVGDPAVAAEEQS